MGISVFAGNKDSIFVTNEHAANTKQNERKAQNKGNNIFAGDLNMQNNTIEMKRKLAQKRAMKIVSDTFASEQDIDRNIDGLKAQQEQLRKDSLEDKKAIKEIHEKRDQLMEDYGITQDSKEHNDLELLRKERDSNNPLSDVKLTDEEKEYLAKLHENGLTNYQKDMLELDEREDVYRERADKKDMAAKAISNALFDIDNERLKTHPILDATKEADKIMDAANKEVIGSLLNEAVDHIDEKIEEETEKAKEQADNKEEEEEKIEERRKDKEELEKQIEKVKENASNIAGSEIKESSDIPDITDIINSSTSTSNSNLEREIEKMVEELNLIMEDLKGSKIDLNI